MTQPKNLVQNLSQDQLYRVLVRNIQDYAIYMLGPDGTIMSWNKGAELLKGYQEEEVIGTHFSRFFRKEDQRNRRPQKLLQEAAEVGRVEDTGLRVRKDGSTIWVNVVVDAIHDENGDLIGFGKVTRRLTSTNPMIYETLVRNIEDYAIYMLDLSGRVVSWNRGAERIKGYTADEIIGKPFATFFLPEDRERGVPQQMLDRARTHRSVEERGRRRRKDGTTIWVHAVIDAIHDDNGQLIGFAKVARDISEQLQNETALKSVAERILVETIPDGIITIDELGVVQSFNPAAERMFGYRASEVIGKNVRMLMPKPYQQEHDGYLRNYRESGHAKVIGIGREVEARRKDGTVFPIELAVGEFQYEGSRQFAGVIRDITERKEVEAEARQLAAIVESSEAAIIGQDLEGLITSWNRGAERLYGYASSEAIGQNVTVLTPPSRRNEVNQIMDRLTRNRRVKPLETIRLHKDGTILDVSIAFSQVRDDDGGLIGVSSVARDITDIKEAERALTASAEQVRALVGTVPDGIVTINATGIVETFNPAAERLFGFEAEEVIGCNVNMLMPEPFHSAHNSYLQNYLNTGEARIIGIGREVEAKRKNGEVFPIELAVGEFQIGDQHMYAGVIRDITERKRFETELRVKNRELEEVNRSKDHFLAGMSHELRTPLNAIMGFTKSLLMELPGTLNDEQKKYLGTVQNSSEHLLSLINDLLDLAKIEAGKSEIALEMLDIQEIVEHACAQLQNLAEQKGLEFVIIPAERPLEALMDRRLLMQVLINLVNNAIKFTERGSVRVELQQTTLEGYCGVISVVDTGIGIAAEDQEKLFEAFVQVDTGSTRQYEGTGLGLHLSKSLCELIGGKVTVVSTPEHGSTFTVLIPTPERALAAQERNLQGAPTDQPPPGST